MVQPVPRFVLVFTELDKETQTNTAGKTSRLGTSIVSFALVLPELSTCRVVCTVYSNEYRPKPMYNSTYLLHELGRQHNRPVHASGCDVHNAPERDF